MVLTIWLSLQYLWGTEPHGPWLSRHYTWEGHHHTRSFLKRAVATPVVSRLQGVYLVAHIRRAAPAFLLQSTVVSSLAQCLWRSPPGRQWFPPLPGAPGEALPALFTGSALAVQAAKASGTEGRHLGKRADVLAQENSWKNQSLFLPKHTCLYAAAPWCPEPAEDLGMQWAQQSRKEKRARAFNSVSQPLRITFLDVLLIETLIIFKPGKSVFFCCCCS